VMGDALSANERSKFVFCGETENFGPLVVCLCAQC
jgi:hypothetical protein